MFDYGLLLSDTSIHNSSFHLEVIDPSKASTSASTSMATPTKGPRLVWYLAYGSNMSSAKFAGSRGIVPLETARVRLPEWVLTLEIPGLPYSEPSFSSIAPRACIEKDTTPCLVGVAYLITQDQYRLVVASEGGGTAYRDVSIRGEPLEAEDAHKVGQAVWVQTLGTAISRRPWPAPSRRYKVMMG